MDVCFNTSDVMATVCIGIYFYLHLCLITKLDKENNQCIRVKNRSTEYSKGNKTVAGKVATTHTEDGHKQGT